MGIETIKGVGPATVKKLDNAGVRTMSDMREMDTELVSKRTGIAKRNLDEWRMEARILKVLDDVKGIGPATKKRLADAGIHSLDDLAKASADQVAKKAKVAKQRADSWQKDAKRLVQQTQKGLEKKGRDLKTHGDRVAESARKQAGAATQKGRKAADDLMEQVRARKTTKSPPATGADPAASGDVREPSVQDPGTNGSHGEPGTNGQTGLISRLRRIFLPR